METSLKNENESELGMVMKMWLKVTRKKIRGRMPEMTPEAMPTQGQKAKSRLLTFL